MIRNRTRQHYVGQSLLSAFLEDRHRLARQARAQNRRHAARPQGADLDAAYTRLRCARAAYQGAVRAWADDKTLAPQLAQADREYLAAFDALEALKLARAI